MSDRPELLHGGRLLEMHVLHFALLGPNIFATLAIARRRRGGGPRPCRRAVRIRTCVRLQLVRFWYVRTGVWSVRNGGDGVSRFRHLKNNFEIVIWHSTKQEHKLLLVCTIEQLNSKQSNWRPDAQWYLLPWQVLSAERGWQRTYVFCVYWVYNYSSKPH